MLEWARENGCPWDSDACMFAAQEGNLSTLQWLRAKGCPWDERVCRCAALGGHLEVLRWARENGCRWDLVSQALAARLGYWDNLGNL